VASYLPQMDPDIIAAQPSECWRCVEDHIDSAWHFKAKEAARYGGNGRPPPGWLIPALFERLHAVDVPVARLFTLCSLSARQGR